MAIKRVIAWQLAQIMKSKKISKKTMAARMRTSFDRSSIGCSIRGMDQCSLKTITRAAKVVGKRIRLELVDAA